MRRVERLFIPGDNSVPSDPAFNCKGTLPGQLGYFGGGYGTEGSPGMFAGGPMAYRFSDCTDGLSNTFLLGENAHQIPSPSSIHQLPYERGHHERPSELDHSRVRQVSPAPLEATRRTRTTASRAAGFNSLHPGGVNMALSDGSVLFVNDTIDYRVWNLWAIGRTGKSSAPINRERGAEAKALKQWHVDYSF